jgi:tyrosinase
MPNPFVRVDVWSLAEEDPILIAYGDALVAMLAKPAGDPTNLTYQAAIHGTESSPSLAQWNQCQHGTWFFLSWHRAFLYFFERIVRSEVVKIGGPGTWALPYWNYGGGGNHNALPLGFRNQTRANGSVNPLYMADRGPGINSGMGLGSSITSPAIALACASFTGDFEFGGGVTTPGQFNSQTGRLEQTPHNDVHSAMGGLMAVIQTAAKDPIFWLHHANIDRIWWLWQQQHPGGEPSDPRWTGQSFSFFDADGSPAALTGAGVVDIVNQLDYTYELAHVDHQPGPPSWHQPPQLRPAWPRPWPPSEPPSGQRPFPPGPGPEVVRQLVGATEQSVTLVGGTVTAPVTIDERAIDSLSDARVQYQRRAFLNIDDIQADRNPNTVYGVYVNLPDQPSEGDLESHHVGNVSLFGIERALNPRGDEHAHGLHFSMEITGLLDRLAADGSWQDGAHLDVTFRPIPLEAPPDRPDLTSEAILTAHPETPVTIGRVSLHFA